MDIAFALMQATAQQAPDPDQLWASIYPFIQQSPIAMVLYFALRYQTKRIEAMEVRRSAEEKERQAEAKDFANKCLENEKRLAVVIQQNTAVMHAMRNDGIEVSGPLTLPVTG